MRFKQTGNKNDIMAVVVKNAESSSAITAGDPVCLVMNGTNDGLGVVLPATGAATKAHALAFGVALNTIAAGEFGEAQIFGFCQRVKYSRAKTRSDNSASYSTVAAVSVGELMLIDTINNALYAGGLQAVSGFLPVAVACEALASSIGIASTVNTLATYYLTGYCKAFLRMM